MERWCAILLCTEQHMPTTMTLLHTLYYGRRTCILWSKDVRAMIGGRAYCGRRTCVLWSRDVRAMVEGLHHLMMNMTLISHRAEKKDAPLCIGKRPFYIVIGFSL